MTTDRELLGLMHEGDWLRHFVATLVPAQDVDDVVQATWLAALRADRLVDSARGWLCGVAANVARLLHRKRARGERARHHVAAPDGERTGAELVEALETQRLVTEALLALPEPTRTVLVLRYREGLSTAAIAARVHLDAAAVRQRLHRGRQAVRERLAQRLGTDWRGSLAIVAFARRSAPAPVGAAAAFVVLAAAAAALVVLAPWSTAPTTGSAAAASPAATQSRPVFAAADPAADVGGGANARTLVADTQDPPPAPKPARVTLRGRLVAAEDETPVAGRVGPHDAGTATAADGTFAIALDRDARDALVWLRADGRCDQYFSGPLPTDTDLGDIPMRRGTAIRGLVLDEQGAPAAGVSLTFPIATDARAGGRIRQSHTTGDDGRFTVSRLLPFGTVKVTTTTGLELLDGDIEVVPPPASDHFVLHVRRRAAVRGVVFGADGRPCGDVELAALVVLAPGSLDECTSCRSAADGSFELFQPNGTDGPVHIAAARFGAHDVLGAPETVAWGTSGLRLEARPRVPCRLRLVEADGGASIEAAQVTASTRDGDRTWSDTIRQLPNGVFAHDGLAAGMHVDVWPEDPLLAPCRLAVDEGMRHAGEIVVPLSRLLPRTLTLVDLAGRPVEAECWLVDCADAPDSPFADDPRAGISTTGRHALRLCVVRTGANGTAELLAPAANPAPVPARRLALEVRRGDRRARLPLTLPAGPDPLRVVVPD